ncbi:hypothetical protein BO70DRAFT_394449 [Aspergillus heteromorphus CBS 117.55]|uniref:Chromatin modification-related protein n=1 Tax=Aspergillus heteromorphus CBS 117.55 TaxID=1448321 RepID=A0A317WMS1_9EURO|nr:uncharacterized protein BO70DRAFT_394449 [Aspergillus heteromorphus CBS 117.55]PWY87563.1 hypothetical protein BO70DRAFT_394449 [Aspergillus heteromorphus CBS 117.55]
MSTTTSALPHGQGQSQPQPQPHPQTARQSTRQTRTNPSRTSRTVGRSSFAYGHGHASNDPASATPVAHGFYPALTHFTDAITALPREFRRHNSLLKEVDAKAWALEDNLLLLLQAASESRPVPFPGNPAPVIAGAVREDLLPEDLTQPPETPESKTRRSLFDRVRHTLSDLMMTADEKNHVISNANDELDRQLTRLDTIFPFIAGEISDEARLGSLTHWAYSNRNVAKTTTAERPRREAASTKDLVHAIHEAEVASRSEARREAVMARRRRPHADSDLDDGGAGGSGAGGAHGQGGAASGQAKRRKVERPPVGDAGAAMERSASGAGAGASGRAVSKDADATKKRSRAPNANAAARKRNTTNAAAVDSPVLAPSPVVTAATVPRSAASPGPGAVRPPSSRTQQGSGPANSNRQRPSSSASNRAKPPTSKPPSKKRQPPKPNPLPPPTSKPNDPPSKTNNPPEISTKPPAPLLPPTKREREDPEGSKPAPSIEPRETPAPPISNPPPNPKGRSSKTSTPVLAPFSEPAPAPKNGSVPAVPPPARAASEEDESLHEGDDEDEDGEPRYCYCNEISFGEMVACDNDACPREWFHLSCVGLNKPPGKNVKWYCNECKESMRRSRSGR